MCVPCRGAKLVTMSRFSGGSHLARAIFDALQFKPTEFRYSLIDSVAHTVCEACGSAWPADHVPPTVPGPLCTSHYHISAVRRGTPRRCARLGRSALLTLNILRLAAWHVELPASCSHASRGVARVARRRTIATLSANFWMRCRGYLGVPWYWTLVQTEAHGRGG